MSAQGWATSLTSSLPDIHCWNLLGNGVIALAAGFVALVALTLLGRYFPEITSARIRLTAFIGFVLAAASLLSWQTGKRELMEAENLAILKAFDAEANRLFEESLRVSNADEHAAYMAKADLFEGRLERWVAESMGPKASEILQRHDPKHVNMNLESTVDKNHASAVVTLVQARENIAALIEAGASDKCVKPTTVEHPIPNNPD
jgi:hypothetical protein